MMYTEQDDFNKKYNKAMNIAVRLLAQRNHTKYEIRQKLRTRSFDTEVIEKIIAECERLRYINDEETARFYLRELQSKGYGAHRIRFSMKKKGLSEELTEQLLSQYNSQTDELENACRVIQNKLKTFNREKDVRKRKEKIYRFLYSRGFSSSVISEVIRNLKFEI